MDGFWITATAAACRPPLSSKLIHKLSTEWKLSRNHPQMEVIHKLSTNGSYPQAIHRVEVVDNLWMYCVDQSSKMRIRLSTILQPNAERWLTNFSVAAEISAAAPNDGTEWIISPLRVISITSRASSPIGQCVYEWDRASVRERKLLIRS